MHTRTNSRSPWTSSRGNEIPASDYWNITLCFQVGVHHPEEQGPAHLFLAQYYMKMGSFREAEAHAHKSTNFVGVRMSLTQLAISSVPEEVVHNFN